jgi:hypothetical protein
MTYGIFNICCEYSNQNLQKNLIPWKKNAKTNFDKITTTQYGLLVNYYDNIYILSTAHGFPNKKIINNIFFECYLKNSVETIHLNIKISIIENDLIFLCFKNINDISKILSNYICITNDMLSTKLVLDNDNVCMYDNDNNIINLEIHSLIKGRYNSYQYCEDMFYNIIFNDIDLNNIRNISNNTDGLSGYPIFQLDDTDKLIGIVNSVSIIEDTKILFIIPSIYITRILNELINYNTFQGFCNLYFDFEIVDKKNISNTITKNYDKLNYLVVTNTLGISYNYYSAVLEGKKLNNLKKNDIIIEIDDLPITNGCVYDKNLNLNIDIISYNNIKKSIYEKTKFKIIRNNNNSYSIKFIEIYNRSINSTKIIKHSPITNFLNYKNHIFIELNKNFVNYILEKNSNYKNIINNLDTKISNDVNYKIILLYDFPDKSSFNNSELLILYSINDIIINNLDFMKQNLIKTSNNFKFKNLYNNKKNLVFNL